MKNYLPGTTRYIDPLTDFGFKLLFSSDPNKEILIDFLNVLFKGEKLIKDKSNHEVFYNKLELSSSNFLNL